MRDKLYMLACGLALSGCAGVQVQALIPNGQQTSGQPGLRYYMPRPYLLVTAVPVAPLAAPADDTAPPAVELPPAGHAAPAAGHAAAARAAGVHDGMAPPPPPVAGAAAPAAAPPDKSKADPTGNMDTTQPVATATTDTSYQHIGSGYQIKLVYFPDRGRMMTITQHSGLFGTVSSQPTLVNGWMLSSLQSSADNKTAETLTAVAGLVGAALGSPAKPAAAAAATKAAGADRAKPPPPPPGSALLPTGLYGFEYNDASGAITSLCYVTLTEPPPSGFSVGTCSTDVKNNAAGPWAPSEAR